MADLMRPVEPGFLEAIPISDKVNKVANTGPDIHDRVDRRLPLMNRTRASSPEPRQTKLL